MKQAASLTITGGRLVTPEGLVNGAIRMESGAIAALGADVTPHPGDSVFAAHGRLVAPGLVDLGVFSVDKPAFHFGGITRAALMPDQSPPLDYPSRVNYIAKSGTRQALLILNTFAVIALAAATILAVLKIWFSAGA